MIPKTDLSTYETYEKSRSNQVSHSMWYPKLAFPLMKPMKNQVIIRFHTVCDIQNWPFHLWNLWKIKVESGFTQYMIPKTDLSTYETYEKSSHLASTRALPPRNYIKWSVCQKQISINMPFLAPTSISQLFCRPQTSGWKTNMYLY